MKTIKIKIAVIAAVTIAWLFFFLLPGIRNIESLQTHATEVENQLSKHTKMVRESDVTDAEAERIRQQLEGFYRYLPRKTALSAFRRSIDSLAALYNVTVEMADVPFDQLYIVHQTAAAGDSILQLQVEIAGEGDFLAVGEFVQSIEEAPFYQRGDRFYFESVEADGDVAFDIMLTLFFQGESQ